MSKSKVIKSKIRTLWTHKFVNKVIPDKRKKKDKHKKKWIITE